LTMDRVFAMVFRLRVLGVILGEADEAETLVVRQGVEPVLLYSPFDLRHELVIVGHDFHKGLPANVVAAEDAEDLILPAKRLPFDTREGKTRVHGYLLGDVLTVLKDLIGAFFRHQLFDGKALPVAFGDSLIGLALAKGPRISAAGALVHGRPFQYAVITNTISRSTTSFIRQTMVILRPEGHVPRLTV
jgi:hypothetical protein